MFRCLKDGDRDGVGATCVTVPVMRTSGTHACLEKAGCNLDICTQFQKLLNEWIAWWWYGLVNTARSVTFQFNQVLGVIMIRKCSEINHHNDDNDGKKTSMTRDTSKYEKCFSYTTACMVILEWACVLMVFDSKTQRILSYSWLSNTLTHPRLKGHLFEIRACRIPWLRQRLPKIRWNVVMYFQYHFMITSDFSSSFFWVWSTFLPCFYSFHFWN